MGTAFERPCSRISIENHEHSNPVSIRLLTFILADPIPVSLLALYSSEDPALWLLEEEKRSKTA